MFFVLFHWLHPGKSTWNLKMEVWKMIFLFFKVQNVNFQACVPVDDDSILLEFIFQKHIQKKGCVTIWMFPKIVVPPNHPF